eukprot:12142673-Ditylum_brightwellii.AAC.1
MSAKAIMCKNVSHGANVNSMADKEYNRYPYFDKIIGTCAREITKDEYDLCIKSFPYLFKLYQEKSHVEDSVFVNVLGFSEDETIDGVKVQQTAS